ncbi:Protein of unknown function [Hymenobacter daecheongensis DSM 21074]|uniref:Putative zinc-ribbon domain-containing protein n=1 Tax=Hymenobacter daecheongensis DSM 21074 TaxID=1121955 RepID=A0A1M6E6K1_9BACT|nr:DUF3667 domain-containing protein [Hymenobacter daecheongensis]SHI81126.1 Protein of unknown function [Hymenobacter daecheongensis DSM 21074]
MSKHRRKTAVCPNCGTSLASAANFCPTCGQENHDLKVPLGHLLYELIEGIFHFDAKFWTTARTLFTRPGQITHDFVAGRRARYVPPVRLYIFVSLIFFFLVTKLSDTKLTVDEANLTQQQQSEARFQRQLVAQGVPPAVAAQPRFTQFYKEFEQQLLDSLRAARRRPGSTAAAGAAELERQYARLLVLQTRADSLLLAQSNRQLLAVGLNYTGTPTAEKRPFTLVLPRGAFVAMRYANPARLDSTLRAHGQATSWYNRTLLRQTARIMSPLTRREGMREGVLEQSRELLHRVVKNASLMMFLLMPVVAGLLLLLYWRHSKFYYEHLIFSVHLHTIIFLVLSLVCALWLITGLGVAALLGALVLLGVYFWLALKTMYGQNIWRTTFKFGVFTLCYALSFALLSFLTGVWSFLTF